MMLLKQKENMQKNMKNKSHIEGQGTHFSSCSIRDIKSPISKKQYLSPVNVQKTVARLPKGPKVQSRFNSPLITRRNLAQIKEDCMVFERCQNNWQNLVGILSKERLNLIQKQNYLLNEQDRVDAQNAKLQAKIAQLQQKIQKQKNKTKTIIMQSPKERGLNRYLSCAAVKQQQYNETADSNFFNY